MPELITDDEASTLTQAFPVADDSMKDQIRVKLDAYRQQEEDAGREMFSGLFAKEARRRAAIASRFSNPDTLGLDGTKLAELNAKTASSPDPRAEKMMRANMEWLIHNGAADPATIAKNYPLRRDDFARRAYGLSGVQSEESFYNATAKHIEKQKTTDELFNGLSSSAQTDALAAAVKGGNAAESFAAWDGQAQELPGYDFQKKGEYQQEYMAQFRDAFSKSKQNAPVASQLYDILARKLNVGLNVGLDETTPGKRDMATPDQIEQDEKDLNAITEQLLNSTYLERKRHIYPLIAELAKGQEDPKSFITKLGQAFSRSAGNALTSVLKGAARALVASEIMGEEADPEGRASMDAMNAKRDRIASEIQRIGGVEVSPLVGHGMLQRSGIGAANIAGILPAAFLGSLSIPANYAIFKDQTKAELREQYPQMSEDQLDNVSSASGALQAAMMGLNAKLVMGKLPWLSGIFKPLENQGAGALLGRLAARGAVGTAEGAAIGQMMGISTPVVQGIAHALNEDVPGVDWNAEVWGKLKNVTGEGGWIEQALTMVPLVLIGTGHSTMVERRAGDAIVKDRSALKLLGFNDEQIAKIQGAKNQQERDALIQGDWTQRSPEIALQAIQEQQAASKAAGEVLASKEFPKITALSEKEFRVEYPDGTGGQSFPDQNSALHHAVSWMDGKLSQHTEEVRNLVKFYQEKGVDISLENRRKTLQDAIDAGDVTPETAIERMQLANLHAGLEGGEDLSPSMIPIRAENVAELRGDLFHASVRIYEGAHPLDVVQEVSEAWFRREMHENPDFHSDAVANIRDYEAASGDKLLPDGKDVSAQAAIEAFSQLAQSHFLNKAKDSALPAGLKKTLSAITEFFKAVFNRAAVLLKMQGEGKAPHDLTRWLEKATGLTEGQIFQNERAKHEAALKSELLGEAAFSITPPGHFHEEWNGVKPGDSWNTVKSLLPRLKDSRPKFSRHGTYSKIVERVASWLNVKKTAEDPWGATVTLNNPQKRGKFSDEISNRAAHLIGRETVKGTENRVLDPRKAEWVGAVPETIRNAQARVRQGTETLYFKRYAEGLHMVVTEGGKVKDQYGLVTQYAPEPGKGFEGATVERTQPMPAKAAQGEAERSALPQGQPDDQTKQTSTNPLQGQSATDGGKGQASFSISPPAYIERLNKALAAKAAKPEFKQKVLEEAARRLKIVHQAHSDRLAAAGPSRAGEIEKERRERQSTAYEARMQAMPDALKHAAELPAEMAKLKEHPVISEILDAAGGIISRSEAIRRGKETAGDYDGAPRLPMIYGGTQYPDQVAQHLYESGHIKEPTTDALWSAIERAQKETGLTRADMRKAAEYERNAAKEARDAANTWADKQRTKAPSISRKETLAAIAQLDAILSALPADVARKVGGYTDIAALATDEARVEHLESRIAKIEPLLEKYLRVEIDKQVQKLFDRSEPKQKSGEKPKGKLGADGHALMTAADKARLLDDDHTQAELARLDSLIMGGTLTPEQEALAMRERSLVELTGDWKNADAARRTAALEALKSTYDGEWLKWSEKIVAKREARAKARDELKLDTGKDGTAKERNAQRDAATTLLGRFKNTFLSLSSFSEVVGYVFGRESENGRRIVDAERKASNQYEDANQALGNSVSDLFTGLAGGDVVKGEQLRFDLSQPSIDTKEGRYSQLQAIQALLMWKQEDGRRHMEGPRDEAGLPVPGKWQYDQAFVDGLTSAMSPEGREVMRFIESQYAGEHAELNVLYRERHGVNLPKHDNYAPITVAPMQAKAGQMVDPVSGASVSGSILTPGSLRSRNRSAIAEPEFRDALQTLIAHKKQMEHWKAYYDFAVNAQALIGNRDLANSVEAAAGAEGLSVLRKWVEAFGQGGVRDAGAGLEYSKLLNRMVGRASTAALLGRVSTLLVQSTQLAAASVEMPMGEFIKRFGKLMSGNLAWGEAMRSDFIRRRMEAMPPVVRQAMEGLANSTRPNLTKHLVVNLGKLLNGADALFTAGTYAMILDYQRGQAAKLGLKGAEAEAFAHAEAVRGTERVAQPTRMANRSMMELTSTNPLARAMWAFASESRQKIALTAWAAQEGIMSPRFAKAAFLTVVVGGFGAQVIKNLWREAKGDDDERKWSSERLAIATAANVIAGFPAASAIFDAGSNLFSGPSRAKGAAENLVHGKDDDTVEIMRDVDSILFAMALFNENAAAISALSHAGMDAAKLLNNATGGQK